MWPMLDTTPVFIQKSPVGPVPIELPRCMCGICTGTAPSMHVVVYAMQCNGWSVSESHIALGTRFGDIVDAWAQAKMVPRQFVYMTFWDDIGFITDDDVVVGCQHLNSSKVLKLRCGPNLLAMRHYKVIRQLTRKHNRKILSFPPVPAFQ